MTNKITKMTAEKFVTVFKCDDKRYTVKEVVEKFYQDRFTFGYNYSPVVKDWDGSRIVISDIQNINYKY